MLREYQTDLIEGVRESLRACRRVLVVLPTGAGKTITFCSIAARSVGKNNNVLVLTHRIELLWQISDRLTTMGVEHGVIAPKHPITHNQVQVASIQTLARRMDAFPWAPNLVIVDEAHHCTARTWRQVVDRYNAACILGWTATPARLDGRGLGDIFEDLVVGPGTARLIQMGYLAKYKLYAPPGRVDMAGIGKRGGDYQLDAVAERVNTDAVVYAAVSNYNKFAGNRSAIAFCVSIAHAQHVCKSFCDAGIPAACIDGTLAPDVRAQRLLDFKAGRLRVLVSVDLISEGFDVPGCECVLLMRPTASLALYLQQIGRALRPSPKEAIILDCVGNVLEHGLPDMPRNWKLDTTKSKRKQDLRAVAIRVCPQCFAVHKPAATCPYCGHVHAAERKLPEEKDAALVEVDSRMAAALERSDKAKRKAEVGKARTLAELQRIAAERGYSPGWPHMILKIRTKGR